MNTQDVIRLASNYLGDLPTPGLEIKAWFPLATEITARFKDSQNHFSFDRTYVTILAWLPDKIIYGKPRILDVCVVSGLSVAVARDTHYHNPPDYLVLEPEDTTLRTANLQQTNTSGYKFQGSVEELLEAQRIVDSWGVEGKIYKSNISGGGKYHKCPWSKYFLVAASTTPQASLARRNGSPERFHSSSNQAFKESSLTLTSLTY